jgi:hypothetical protein
MFHSFDGTVQVDNIRYGNLSHESIVFVVSGNEGAFSVTGGIRDMIRLEMDSDGSFFASLAAPLPIRGSLAGVYKNGIMDAYCNDFYIDMTSLWALTNVPPNIFNIAGGYITGRMNLRGPIWNPEFYGSARGTSLCFKVPDYVGEDLRPVPFNILAEGYEMTFGPVITASGSGAATVTGYFRFEYWIPRNIGLNIIIPRERAIPYNIDIAGFMAEGNASGRLNLALDTDNKLFELRGNLFVNNTEMGLNMDEITINANRELAFEPAINSVIELSITTGSMVQFFWPSINSPILRANPEMGTVVMVFVDTQAGHYSLVSDINIRSGELYYLDRNFYIRQGSLVFRENERQFNPRISARAEIRDRSASGPVTISMIIENEPLLSFVPRFVATPSLTPLEIYSILGQNPNNIQGNDNNDSIQRLLLASSTDILAQVVAGSDAFNQFGYMRQFERQVRNLLNLDMLNIRTRFLQNAVASNATAFGQPPVDRISRVGNYFDNTTVFIGKYIGQDMFIQGTLAMKYDEDRVSFGGLSFEPDIGLELQNPFFSIRWDFFPYHPQNWWVNDHSITLIWSKSF